MMNESIALTDTMQSTATFIGTAISPFITLMVLIITLGAFISAVGAIMYTVFSAIKGSFGGYEREFEPKYYKETEESEPKKWNYEYQRRKLEKYLNTPSWKIARGMVKI